MRPCLFRIWAYTHCPCNAVSLRGPYVLEYHTLDTALALTVSEVIAKDKLWEKGDCLLELQKTLTQ